MTKTLYSIAIFALKIDPAMMELKEGGFLVKDELEPDGATMVRHLHNTCNIIAGSDNALDEKDAQDAGMVEAKRIFPESEGWRGHGATVSAIPDDIVLVAAVYAEQRLNARPDVQEYEM